MGLHLLIFFLLAQSLFGQTQASHIITIEIKEITLLEIKEGTQVSKAEYMAEIGPEDGMLTVWYTCVNRAGQRKRVMVQTDAPVGVLHLEVFSLPAGCGIPVGEVVATGDPQEIIGMIPSCFTGRGSDVGVVYWFSSRVEGKYRILFRLEEER